MKHKLMTAVIVAVTLLLTGCGSNSGSGSGLMSSQKGVNPANDSRYTALACPKGDLVVDLPIGKTINQNNEVYSLSATSAPSPNDHETLVQASVQLSITLDTTTTIGYVIIHVYEPAIGHEDDRSLEVAVNPGGSGSYTLETSSYVYNPASIITSVTLCGSVSSAPASKSA